VDKETCLKWFREKFLFRKLGEELDGMFCESWITRRSFWKTTSE